MLWIESSHASHEFSRQGRKIALVHGVGSPMSCTTYLILLNAFQLGILCSRTSPSMSDLAIGEAEGTVHAVNPFALGGIRDFFADVFRRGY